MKTFYFSGIDKAAIAVIVGANRASGMISFLSYTPRLLEVCNHYATPLVMDSGAYTKTLTRQDIERYARLIVSLRDRCEWYANADVLGDQAASNQNYTFLLSLLPPDLHSRVLWIYQQSGDRRFLHEAIENHARIGIGGLVPLMKAADKTAAFQAVSQIANIAKSVPQVHYFGVAMPGLIEILHTYHAHFSVDSTTYLIGQKFGLLVNTKGQQRNPESDGYDFTAEEMLAQNIRTMRKWVERTPQKTRTLYTQMDFLETA